MPTAMRITVSECTDCKKIWEDAEPHFRNILLGIWNAEALPVDSRVESMWRGLRRVFVTPIEERLSGTARYSSQRFDISGAGSTLLN